jgi:alpha-ribazole phosphatase
VIVLCRHGATQQNQAGAFLSRTDVPLSSLGREQAERLRDALREIPFEHCYCSPMYRCLETREIAVPGVPFEACDALREVDFGDWEGKTVDWLERYEAHALAQRRRDPVNFRPPHGENFADVARRVQPFLASLDRQRTTLILAHRGTLGVVERLLRGLPLESRAVTGLEPGEFRTIG